MKVESATCPSRASHCLAEPSGGSPFKAGSVVFILGDLVGGVPP